MPALHGVLERLHQHDVSLTETSSNHHSGWKADNSFGKHVILSPFRHLHFQGLAVLLADGVKWVFEVKSILDQFLPSASQHYREKETQLVDNESYEITKARISRLQVVD